MEHTTCKRCNRKLKTAKSMVDGLGPVCRIKFQSETMQQLRLPFEDDPKEEEGH